MVTTRSQEEQLKHPGLLGDLEEVAIKGQADDTQNRKRRRLEVECLEIESKPSGRGMQALDISVDVEMEASIAGNEAEKGTMSKARGAMSDSQSESDLRRSRQGTTSIAPKNRVHQRFGSEDPFDTEVLDTGTASHSSDVNGHAQREVEEEEDSEDDAPEAISMATGQNTARMAAAEAAKASKQNELAIKEKRRRRDLKLKEQAKSAKQQKVTPKAIAPDEMLDTSTVDGKALGGRAKSSSRKRDNLPALLPDDILATEAPVRLPTPPPDIEPGPSGTKKRKFIDADPKTIKDIKKGNAKIRVLSSGPSLLPPRASKASKNLKESWLSGQRGRQAAASQRRSSNGGFLRR